LIGPIRYWSAEETPRSSASCVRVCVRAAYVWVVADQKFWAPCAPAA